MFGPVLLYTIHRNLTSYSDFTHYIKRNDFNAMIIIQPPTFCVGAMTRYDCCVLVGKPHKIFINKMKPLDTKYQYQNTIQKRTIYNTDFCFKGSWKRKKTNVGGNEPTFDT